MLTFEICTSCSLYSFPSHNENHCCCSVSKSRPMLLRPHILHHGFPGGSDGEESACSVGDPGLIPRSGRSPGEGTGNPLQYSCLETPRYGGAWWAAVYGVAQSWT